MFEMACTVLESCCAPEFKRFVCINDFHLFRVTIHIIISDKNGFAI